MKRVPMPPRKTPLKARTGLKRGAPLRTRSTLKSSTGRSQTRTSSVLEPRKARSEPIEESTPPVRAQNETWRNAVWSKDRGVCQAGPGGPPERRVGEVKCEGGLDAHHVWPKGAYPGRRFDPVVGVLLCRAHHDWVHGHTNQARARGLFV